MLLSMYQSHWGPTFKQPLSWIASTYNHKLYTRSDFVCKLGILYFSLIHLKSKSSCFFFLHHLCIWSAKGLLHDGKKNKGPLTIK